MSNYPWDPNNTSTDIASQSEATYENYQKVKGVEDVGYFLQAYVVNGGDVTKSVTRNDTILATKITVSLNDDIMTRDGTSFRTTVATTIYYLDFTKDGDWSWGTSHAAGLSEVDYLPIAGITTDSHRNVASIVDYRGTVGGFRLKDTYGLEGYVTKPEFNVLNNEVKDARIDTVNNITYPKLSDRLNANSTQIASKASQASLNSTNALLATKIDLLNKRKNDILRSNVGKLQRYVLPINDGWTWTDAPISLLTDGVRFYTNFDVSINKNVSTTTYYVDPVNGNNSNNGTSEGTAFATVFKAYTVAVSGDTIIMLGSIYSRTQFMQGNTIEKSINIIGKNKVTIGTHDVLSYTKTAGYTYIYQASRTNVYDVVDISLGEPYPYIKVASLSVCDSTPGTWYHDETILYIHTLDGLIPDNNKILALLSVTQAVTTCTTENVRLYMENLSLFGGATGTLLFKNSVTYTTPSVYAKNCDFYFAHGDTTNGNAVNILGAQYAFFQGCKAAYAKKDGFNYHAQNGRIPKAIEVNCTGSNNGDNSIAGTENTNNGSTIHDGGQIIRVNSTYYGNMGCNVADVHVGTKALCLGCSSYRSASQTTDIYNSDFGVQQADAKMWLDSCISFDSLYGLTAFTGTTMYIKNTLFETKLGGGSFIFQ